MKKLPRFNIVYNGYTNPNGALSFVHHLAEMAEQNGQQVFLYRVSKNPRHRKPFFIEGRYVNDIGYEDFGDLNKRDTLIAQLYGNDKERTEEFIELSHGFTTVIHSVFGDSPTYAKRLYDRGDKILCPVETSANWYIQHGIPVTYVPLPLVPYEGKVPKKQGAVSINRISGEKGIHRAVEANRDYLPQNKHIKFYGPITSAIYEFRKLRQMHPEWRSDYYGVLDGIDEVYAVLLPAKYIVDLSAYKLGSGGMEYAILEGLDARCILVLSSEWVRESPVFVHGENCIAVADAKDLFDIITKRIEPRLSPDDTAKQLLKPHTTLKCAQQWRDEV